MRGRGKKGDPLPPSLRGTAECREKALSRKGRREIYHGRFLSNRQMFPGMILELEGKADADALTDTERDRYRAIEIPILISVSL